MTTAEMALELERLKAENAKLKAKPMSRVSFKVSDKGCISVYGLGRFPTTLYRTQWASLINAMPDLQAFIEANAAVCQEREDNQAAAV